MKASDISDETMLTAIRVDTFERWGDKAPGLGACIWTLAEREGWPIKLATAKLNTMRRRRGLVDGCTCGCRGDWTIEEPPTLRTYYSSYPKPDDEWRESFMGQRDA